MEQAVPGRALPRGGQTVDVPTVSRSLVRGVICPGAIRPAGSPRAGGSADRDLVVFALLIPPQAIPYLAILAGLRGLRPGRRPARRAVVICHNVLPHESEGRPTSS